MPAAVEIGLSNVRTLDAEPSEYLGHDVIADGPESCPLSGLAEDDPLKGRPTFCGEISPSEPPTFGMRQPMLGLVEVRSTCDANAAAPFDVEGRADTDRVGRNATFVDQEPAAGYSVHFGDSTSHKDARWLGIACLPDR
jgi:hypothetical protein